MEEIPQTKLSLVKALLRAEARPHCSTMGRNATSPPGQRPVVPPTFRERTAPSQVSVSQGPACPGLGGSAWRLHPNSKKAVSKVRRPPSASQVGVTSGDGGPRAAGAPGPEPDGHPRRVSIATRSLGSAPRQRDPAR